MEFYTLTEAAAECNVSRQWMYAWLKRNNLLSSCLSHIGPHGKIAFLRIPAKLLKNFPSKKKGKKV
jgi:hypothetical protein